LDETILPPIHTFYNDLTKSECGFIEYNRAIRAWSEFKCKDLRDYLLAYLKMDVYHLADVFESFRKLALEEDGVDAVNFFGIPGFC